MKKVNDSLRDRRFFIKKIEKEAFIFEIGLTESPNDDKMKSN